TILAAALQASLPLNAWEMKKAPLMTKYSEQVDPKNPLPEYPRPQLARQQWLNLNGIWEFEGVEGINKRIPSAEWKGVDESIFKDVKPGKKLSGEILVPYPVESALSGVMKHYEYIKYRREFEIPQNWKGENVRVNFGAVDFMCDVYINGKLAGSHQGGYDAFSFDITKLLKDGKNEVIVSVYDPTDNGIQPVGKQRIEPEGYWYTPCSGIWQTVWLEPVKKGAADQLKMIPNAKEGYLAVTVKAEEILQKVKLEAFDGKKKVGEAFGTANREIRLEIPNAKLWSPDSPFLYDLKITMFKDGKAIDEVSSYFGMRDLGKKVINGITRPTINGEFVFHIGTLDQGYWPDGNLTAPTDEALKSDIQNHKDLGFNMIRKHIKVEPARWFYWCDKIGILVWQDFPNSHTHIQIGKNVKHISFRPNAEEQKIFEAYAKEIVDEHISHPSIAAWVLFNEGWSIYPKREDIKRVSDWLSAYDPSRYVNDSTGLPNEHVSGDVYDLHIYQGPSAGLLEPYTFAALGEFGGVVLNVKGHNWFDRGGWAYGAMNSNNEELTNRYLQMQGELYSLMFFPGLSASMYTQISDVEGETNGLYTYDRKVLKMDAKKLKAAHDKITAASKNMPEITNANSELSLGGKKGAASLNGGKEPKFAFLKNKANKEADITAAIATCEVAMPQKADASAGIVMRHSKDGAYLLGIKGDGTIFIKSLKGKDEKILAEKKTALKGKISLKAQAFGSVLYLDANGERIFAKDAFIAYGKFGVFAQDTDAKFSNFAFSNPAKRIRAINTTVKFFVLRNENKMWPCILDCNPKEMGDCHWELEKGLADPNGVSFRSMSQPNKYLSIHEDGRVYLKEYENTPEFKKNATFYQRKGNYEGLHSSFESMAKPGEFFKHIGWRLAVCPVKTGGEKYDSTFELIE
ncbi:MAG: AbfB domain-containing protein, partial [Opitutales bacterium]|nr:AbfB domain-containing protein [Opitutales bacterium]